MLKNIEVLNHSAIKINLEKVIYIDPFNIEISTNDADIIFITHDHFDHYSEKDIDKVKNVKTIFVVPEGLSTKLIETDIRQENIITVLPYQKDFAKKIEFETVPAYNSTKPFHPKENNWLGYVIIIDNIRYYIAGDTDITEDNKNVKCDVAFVPVGRNLYNDFKRSSRIS